MIEHFDVLVVGAGLSGIGAGVHLLNSCKGKTFAVLEAREAIGGTWDLFRYPGIRSDSDMYTLGYPFKPWLDAKAIADGPAILDYIRETAVEYGVDKRIRYSQRLVKAAWDSLGGCWTVTVEKGGAREIIPAISFSCAWGITITRKGICRNFRALRILAAHWCIRNSGRIISIIAASRWW